MFRWLYMVVLVGGIFWIVSAQPMLMNPVAYVESVMKDKSPPPSDEKEIVLFPGEAGRPGP